MAKRVNGNSLPRGHPKLRARRKGAHETALDVLKDIESGRLHPHSIDARQRRACLLFLANGTHTGPELGALFGVDPRTIRSDLRDLREEIGREVRTWTPDQVVGDLVHAADKYAARALKQEDTALAWKIKLDLFRALREAGLVGGSPGEEGGVRITIEGLGERYERVRGALALTVDPLLTGEVIEGEGRTVRRGEETPPPLPLDRKIAGAPEEDPQVEIRQE